MVGSELRRFRGVARRTRAGGITIRLIFQPDRLWGDRPRYIVAGTVDGIPFRASLAGASGGWSLRLGPRSPASAGVADGQSVLVEIQPEGPQLGSLSPDIAAALAKRPAAESAFAALATFYRKGWLRWIDATKRRPELRTQRIEEMLVCLEAGRKERPASI